MQACNHNSMKMRLIELLRWGEIQFNHMYHLLLPFIRMLRIVVIGF